MELIRQDHASVTANGLDISHELTLEQWAEIGLQIRKATTAMQFAIGDWLVYGQEHFEGAPALPGMERKAGRVAVRLLDYACELTRIDRAELINYAYVARNVPKSLRTDLLSFTHYEILAKLPESEQRQWIELATTHSGRVPTRQLAHSIKLSKDGDKRIWSKEEIVAVVSDDAKVFIDAPEAMLDKFIRSLRRQNFNDWTPAMRAFLHARFNEASELLQTLCPLDK